MPACLPAGQIADCQARASLLGRRRVAFPLLCMFNNRLRQPSTIGRARRSRRRSRLEPSALSAPLRPPAREGLVARGLELVVRVWPRGGRRETLSQPSSQPACLPSRLRSPSRRPTTSNFKAHEALYNIVVIMMMMMMMASFG